MRWFAAFLFFGSPMCDRRIAVEAQPETRGLLEEVEVSCILYYDRIMPKLGSYSAIRTKICQYVTEIYERKDGMRYAKEHEDCGYDVFMRGPCR